jgi:hypothetical protein
MRFTELCAFPDKSYVSKPTYSKPKRVYIRFKAQQFDPTCVQLSSTVHPHDRICSNLCFRRLSEYHHVCVRNEFKTSPITHSYLSGHEISISIQLRWKRLILEKILSRLFESGFRIMNGDFVHLNLFYFLTALFPCFMSSRLFHKWKNKYGMCEGIWDSDGGGK